MIKNILKLATSIIIALGLTTAVHAATSIRLEQPKSPTNQNSIDINFVTLDTNGGTITVKCLKKGPSDGGFSQFGADIVLTPAGGNTGDCSVNNSILNADGTYQFKAQANGIDSNIVTVDFNNSSSPGTPTNYGKEQPSSCVWRIKFRTADDGGKTVKVEVYRSENTSFNADNGSRVATVSIGSNTDGQTDVTSPDCSKTYYFAIRAFDSFGNGSGVVGDSVTITTNPTTTTASPSPAAAVRSAAIPLSSGTSQVSQESSILGQKTEEPEVSEVLAVSTSSAATPLPSTSPTTQNQESNLFSLRNIIIGTAVLVILALVYFFLIRKKPQPPLPPVEPPAQFPTTL